MWFQHNIIRAIFYVWLVFLMVFLGYRISQGNWLQTDLKALLPEQQRWSLLQIEADQQLETRLNRQIVALIGADRTENAFRLAQQIQQQWQASGLFVVEKSNMVDLAQVRQEVAQIAFATLPTSIRQQLLTNPRHYFEQYAEQIANPFLQTNLLSLEQDWLGFGRFTLTQAQMFPRLQWDSQTGLIFTSSQGNTWVLLQTQLAQSELVNPQQSLLNLMEQSRSWVNAQQGQFWVTGASLFASVAKQQAEQEMSLMSAMGISLTLLLLLSVFRSGRALWLFFPIIIGMVSGVIATIFYFEQIHLLTLVVGTSLVGVLLDFPLHWLASSLFHSHWSGERAMAKLGLSFGVSLFITLLGYLLLWFTALPILKQTALFSAVALIMAVLSTMLFLPSRFRDYQPKAFVFNASLSIPYRKVLGFGLLLFIGVGLAQAKWQDDIRQWVAMPPQMLDEARQISEITGVDLGSQYFLLTAENEQALLDKDRQLSEQLAKLPLTYQSLSQWIMSPAEQKALALQIFQKIQPLDYAILGELGVETAKIKTALTTLTNATPTSLSQALSTQLGQGWRTLYLGEMQGKVASLIKVANVPNGVDLTSFANQQDVFWQDKRASLNQSFQATRNQAMWLKLGSIVFAGLFLWRLFGKRKACQILLPPLSAVFFVIALFGWLGLPISLFTMFGLLLVSAIGIDYSVYFHTVDESQKQKWVAISLACLTTLISFLLLGLSSTPAVASFGVSVAVGAVVSVFSLFYLSRL